MCPVRIGRVNYLARCASIGAKILRILKRFKMCILTLLILTKFHVNNVCVALWKKWTVPFVAFQTIYQSNPSEKLVKQTEGDVAYSLRKRGRSWTGPLVPHPAAELVCSLKQLHERTRLTDVLLDILKHMMTMIGTVKWRYTPRQKRDRLCA